MHFHLTEEQTAIQDAVRGTLAGAWPIERLHAFADGDDDFDRASWDALMALCLGGTLVPDSGMGLLDAALACEVVGEAAAPGPLIGQLLAVAAVAHSDNGAAKSHLETLASGEKVATLVHGGSAFVPCARAADFFLIVDREAGVRLVAAADAAIKAVKAADRSS